MSEVIDGIEIPAEIVAMKRQYIQKYYDAVSTGEDPDAAVIRIVTDAHDMPKAVADLGRAAVAAFVTHLGAGLSLVDAVSLIVPKEEKKEEDPGFKGRRRPPTPTETPTPIGGDA